MGEKRRSTSKTLAKNKKRKGTHLKKKTIRDEKRPLNSKINSDDVNEERVPEEEESKKNKSKLPEDFEEDERNLESAAVDEDGENSKLKMERKKKKKMKKKSLLCPDTLKSNIIKDQSYFDGRLAKYSKILQTAPKKKMNPGPIPYYEASPTFIKESMKQMKMKEESEKTTEKKDVSVSSKVSFLRTVNTTWNPTSRKKVPFRARCEFWKEVDAIIKSFIKCKELKSP